MSVVVKKIKIRTLAIPTDRKEVDARKVGIEILGCDRMRPISRNISPVGKASNSPMEFTPLPTLGVRSIPSPSHMAKRENCVAWRRRRLGNVLSAVRCRASASILREGKKRGALPATYEKACAVQITHAVANILNNAVIWLLQRCT